MTQFNLDLANKVMDQITFHPHLHNQRSGSRCVVGWTVKLADGKTKVRHDFSGRFDSDVHRGARLLGIPYDTSYDIYGTMDNDLAKHKLQDLIDAEVKRRETESRSAKRLIKKAVKAQQKRDKAKAKQDNKIAKRHARIEEETQRCIDMQAREQARQANRDTMRKTMPQRVIGLLIGTKTDSRV